jgi:Ser-tRNA(Ala) deacylase AlaX
LDEEYLNTFVREFKNNDNPKNEAHAYSEEKELTIDEPMELEELQKKPKKDDTKSDDKTKVQDIVMMCIIRL